jgi:hypothetical protein
MKKVVIDVPLASPITVEGKQLSVLRLVIRKLKGREERKLKSLTHPSDRLIARIALFSGLPVASVEEIALEDVETILERMAAHVLSGQGERTWRSLL